jgi:hypothetical protein
MSSFATPSAGPPTAAGRSANQLRKLTWFAAFCMIAIMLVASAVVEPADAAKKKRKKDKRPPSMRLVTTGDTDGDGILDQIKITYNENVRFIKEKKKVKRAKAKTAFIVSGHKVKSVRTSRKVVVLTVDEGTKVDTAERPLVSYRRVKKRRKGILDRGRNQAYAGVMKAKDGIAPRLQGARTTDIDRDGRLDGIELTYSEDLSAASHGAITVPGRTVKSVATTGAKVSVDIEEAGVDSDAKPAVEAAAGAATDANGNPQTAGNVVNADDGTPPAITSAQTRDTDADGKVDRVAVTFSENVVHPTEAGGGSLKATGFTTTAVSAAAGSKVDIDFAEGGSVNSGAKPNVEILATGQPVTDLNGNQIASGTFTATTDGSPPIITSARLRDTTADGRIDTVGVSFSETVTYTTAAGAFTTTPGAEAAMGALSTSAVSIGAVVNVGVVEIGACCNTNLPTVGTPVPITYNEPGSGGVVDPAGMPAAGGTVNATDGSGPVVNYAETEDSDANGFIDRMYVGFSEPIATFSGSPLVVASGQRQLDSSSGAAETLLDSGPHAGQVQVKLVELGVDDTADRPTVTYTPSGGTSFARDANLNDAPTTTTPFTATIDKAAPVMRSAYTSDASPLDGHIETITSVWSEPIQTTAGPGFSVAAQNPPSGYAAPTVAATGATATGQTVTALLNASTSPDRDVFFDVTYTAAGGVSDLATTPNAAASPASSISQTADCADVEESIGTHDDSVATASGYLAVNNERHLGTLCGDDSDNFAFSLGPDVVGKVLFSPADEALSMSGRDGGYDPFTVSGPGSPSHTTSFESGKGWTVTFQADSSGGTYTVGVRDSNSPLADYGYCVARSEGAGSTPSCILRQGDLAITEILKDPSDSDTSASRYVEAKNVTAEPIASTDIATMSLDLGGATCDIETRTETPTEIPAGGYFVISATDLTSTALDFSCAAMPAVDYTQQVAIMSSSGIVDAVNLGPGVSVPSHTSVQVRSGTQFETSTGNDDGPAGWCASIDYHGSPAAVNTQCDRFRLEEVMFMPTSSARDGRVMVEIRGNAPINASSSLLADWQIRVRPQVGPQKIYTLSSLANPNASGFYVLADTPDAGGDTYVPFYSEQVSDLDDYVRADVPATVSLLRPGQNCVADSPVDTVGYVPSIVGDLTASDHEDNCVAFIGLPYKSALGFTSNDTLQRKPYAAYSNSNYFDWCAKTPWSPMSNNFECVLQQ